MSDTDKQSLIPENLRYAKSHEWARLEPDGTVTVGITDHAQDQLGDLVFVEFPDIDQYVEDGEECAVVESVKAASDIYSPVSGDVIAINNNLTDSPELVNKDPYGQGWLFKIQPEKKGENSLKHLLTWENYRNLLSEE